MVFIRYWVQFLTTIEYLIVMGFQVNQDINN